MKKYNSVKIILVTFLIFICISTLRIWSFQLSSIIGYFSYFGVIVFLYKKYSHVSSKVLLRDAAIGLLGLQLIARILYFNATLLTLPDFFFHLLGFLSGIVYSSRIYSLPKKSLIVLFGLILTIVFCIVGYKRWFHYINYGSFSGQIEILSSTDFYFEDINHSIISKKSLPNKIIVLDFWFTRCAACFQEFPEFQKLFEKYKNDSDVHFLSVNVPIKGDEFEKTFEMIKKEGYTFPVVINTIDSTLAAFKINSYPTIIVMDKKGGIKYRGDINNLDNAIHKLKVGLL